MASIELKTALYELDITITEIAERAGTTPRNACNALIRWEGKTGDVSPSSVAAGFRVLGQCNGFRGQLLGIGRWG